MFPVSFLVRILRFSNERTSFRLSQQLKLYHQEERLSRWTCILPVSPPLRDKNHNPGIAGKKRQLCGNNGLDGGPAAWYNHF